MCKERVLDDFSQEHDSVVCRPASSIVLRHRLPKLENGIISLFLPMDCEKGSGLHIDSSATMAPSFDGVRCCPQKAPVNGAGPNHRTQETETQGKIERSIAIKALVGPAFRSY